LAQYESNLKNRSGEIIGEFVYYGMTGQLKRIINPQIHEENAIYLQFNFDGILL